MIVKYKVKCPKIIDTSKCKAYLYLHVNTKHCIIVVARTKKESRELVNSLIIPHYNKTVGINTIKDWNNVISLYKFIYTIPIKRGMICSIHHISILNGLSNKEL